MEGNQKEPQLIYALDEHGRMVYIGSVDRGLSCRCRCPKCNEPLVAKLGHEGGRQAHFAHRIGSDCHGSYMTALHKLAEQIIEEEKAVMAPAYHGIESQRLSFTEVELEQRFERKDMQPDIVGVTEDGLRWIVEIRNTHEVDEFKKAKLIESNITCLEIDVREQRLENLKSFILESTEKRVWLNNPNYDAQIVEAGRERQVKEYRNNSRYEIKPAFYCDSECKYKPFCGKCIYKKDTIVIGVISWVLCDKEKRLKDENEYQRQHGDIDDYSAVAKPQLYKKHFQEMPTNPDLPFGKFWTIEECCNLLMSQNDIEIERGHLVKIVKWDNVGNRILILYKDPVEIRTYTPYHVAEISTDNGNLMRNDVAVFINQKSAMNDYNKRLAILRNSMCCQSPIEFCDEDLPF